MTGSHVCTDVKIKAAREEAWEGKDPGSVRVLLANPQWERKLLRYLCRALWGVVGDGKLERRGGNPGRGDG